MQNDEAGKCEAGASHLKLGCIHTGLPFISCERIGVVRDWVGGEGATMQPRVGFDWGRGGRNKHTGGWWGEVRRQGKGKCVSQEEEEQQVWIH